ncbi:MAG: hypothetical protein V4726_11050 [Verrucomicrobiota bacterium]
MAISYSEATRLAIGKALMGGDVWTPPASYDLGLFTGDPNNGGVECTGTGYARIPLANDGTHWGVVAGSFSKTFRNLTDWVFTAAAGAGWGQPNWICLFEAGGSDKVWAFQIDNASPVGAGDPFKVNTGGVTFQFLN